jgi:hypothetical protein
MKIDFETEDALIVVSADRRKGIWSSSSIVRNQRNVKTAGQIETSASAHTLQVVALVSTLKQITRRDITRLLGDTGKQKLTVVVTSGDKSFLAAINAIVEQQPKDQKLRAGRNFLDILREQLDRFHVVVRQLEPTDKTALVLADWAGKQIAAPKLIAGIPPSLAPTVVARNF